jgi:hypothetical protein
MNHRMQRRTNLHTSHECHAKLPCHAFYEPSRPNGDPLGPQFLDYAHPFRLRIRLNLLRGAHVLKGGKKKKKSRSSPTACSLSASLVSLAYC